MNTLKFYIFLSILFFSVNSFSQTLVKIKRKEFKTEKPGFKESWKTIKTANKFFESGPGTYRSARKAYQKAYFYNPDVASLNYMIGVCYIFTDNKYQALEYLNKAYEIDPEISPDIHLMLARAYHLSYQFEEAIKEYQLYHAGLSDRNDSEELVKVNRYITECNNGIKFLRDPQRVVIQSLGRQINSQADDYYSIVDRNDSIMLFTSRRQYEEKDERYIQDNKFFEDIYFAQKNAQDEWNFAKRFNAKTIGKRNETNTAALALANDYKQFYMYQGGKNNGDFYTVKFKKDKWGKPKKMKGKFNSAGKELSISFSEDGKTIYFARISKKDKHGFGGSDIFYSTINDKGKWSKPVNMGNTINTSFHEIFVSTGKNDSVLYLCSNGHSSMGGFDIFKSTLSENGEWSKPVNLGYPINTPDDDLFYTPVGKDRKAYYTSIRETGEGGKDIYQVIYLGQGKDMLHATDNVILAANQKQLADIWTIPPIVLDIDTNISFSGEIIDSDSREPVAAKFQLLSTSEAKVVASIIADTSGQFKITLKQPGKYGVEIAANGYMMYLEEIDLSDASYENPIHQVFELKKLEVGARVVLKNIYFETGKATLKSESFEELDNVVKLMDTNPSLRIEISGHTDNQGSAKINQKISADRAKAVANYLIANGIDKERIESLGYGYSQPIAPNNTKEGRAKNRRVEFKILSN